MQEFGPEDDSALGPLHELCLVGMWTCRVRPRSSNAGVCCCGCSCPKGSVLGSQGPARKPAGAPTGGLAPLVLREQEGEGWAWRGERQEGLSQARSYSRLY